MKKVLTIFLVLVVVLGGGGYLLATQADASEPGDTLYALDLAVEDLQRVLIVDDLKLAELETDILTERIDELESVADTAEDVDVILTEITAQQDRVKDCLGNAESNPEKYQDGELERVQNEYKNQLQNNVQVMEQVSNKVQNAGTESALEVKENLQQNLDLCNTGSCGTPKSETQDTGNSDSGNTDSGSTGGKGNN
jgi:hypothetical protein